MKVKIKTQVLLQHLRRKNDVGSQLATDFKKGSKTVKPFLTAKLWISWSFLRVFLLVMINCSIIFKK